MVFPSSMHLTGFFLRLLLLQEAEQRALSFTDSCDYNVCDVHIASFYEFLCLHEAQSCGLHRKQWKPTQHNEDVVFLIAGYNI